MDQVTQELVAMVDRLKRQVRNQRKELRRLNRKLRFVMSHSEFPKSNREMPVVEELQWKLYKSQAREQFAMNMIARYRAKIAIHEDNPPLQLNDRA